MKIGVLGTGMVGRALAGRLAAVGHDVVVGTRDPEALRARTEPDAMGNRPYAQWEAEHPDVRLGPSGEAAADVDVLVNATNGTASVAALERAGVGTRDGLVVLDVSNPLDFSHGGPLPTLTIASTDSLGETIQRAFPAVRVVKSLNTVNGEVMADPGRVPGPHVVFVSGDDAAAKDVVVGMLGDLGWPAESVVDLGGLVSARATEMYVPLFVATMQSLGTTDFNIALQRASPGSTGA